MTKLTALCHCEEQSDEATFNNNNNNRWNIKAEIATFARNDGRIYAMSYAFNYNVLTLRHLDFEIWA